MRVDFGHGRWLARPFALNLSSVDFWILDKLVELNVCPSSFVHDERGLLFNCKDPGATFEEVRDALLRAARRGWIVFNVYDAAADSFGTRPMDRHSINEQMSGPSVADRYEFLTLTPAGGAAWEAVAEPDWNRYVSWGGECVREGPAVVTIEAASKTIGLRYLRELADVYGVSPIVHVGEALRPWFATEWKTLASGYRFDFFDPDLPDKPCPPDWNWCRQPLH